MTFFENAFLIIIFYWSIFYFFKISISVYEKNYVRKNKRYNLSLSIADINKKVNNLDRRANNLSISIIDKNINKKGNNPDINRGIVDIN